MASDAKIEQQLPPAVSGVFDVHVSAMTWREYHESTKHNPSSLRRTLHVLDWANMPDPFRHYRRRVRPRPPSRSTCA